MAEEEQWKEKYLLASQQLANEEKRWRGLESLLRRTVNRLCLAADGQDDRLDAELKKLTDAMRREAGADELEKIVAPLSEAIAALDQKRRKASTTRSGDEESAAILAALVKDLSIVEALRAPLAGLIKRIDKGMAAKDAAAELARIVGDGLRQQPVVPAVPESANRGIFGFLKGREKAEPKSPVTVVPTAGSSVAEALTQLLERLSVLPDMEARVADLKERIERSTTEAELADILKRIADLVNEQRSRLQGEKGEVERILQQVTERLEEIDNWLVAETSELQTAHESGRDFDQRVLGEVRQLNTQVQEANDLATLQRQVRERLEAIGGHFRDFRRREEARISDWRAKAETMRSRMTELERETSVLRENMLKERHAALVDALTGIPNRLAYDERLGQEIKRSRRTGEPLAIAVWDVDRFKSLNDTYGHKAGDKVLRVLAQHLAQHVRETDFVARYGGEEFVTLFIATPEKDALSVAEGLRGAIERLGFHFRDTPVTITASCGVTGLRENDTPDSLFDRADKALYRAKEQGRNRCILA